MIESRTLTSHTCNENIAEKIAADIVSLYYPEFKKLYSRIEALKGKMS